MARKARLLITVGKGGVRSIGMFFKAKLCKAKLRNKLSRWLGRKEFHHRKQNREVVIKHNDSSVRVGVLL